MSNQISAFWAQPLQLTARQPIRIAVYSRLASGIRSGILPAGTLLPKEAELADMLDVSRTPVREALILLEEDGLLTTKRGVGRFVSSTLPSFGLEKIQPFEAALANADKQIEVMSKQFMADMATEFVSEHLDIETGDETWFKESVIAINHENKVIVQEHIPINVSTSHEEQIQRFIRQHGEENQTLLKLLMDSKTWVFQSGKCRIHASTAGKSRAELLHVDPDEPVLILTQVITCDDKPVYLAKVILTNDVSDLSIMQSTM